MWRDFFGPKARIIGVDLNPDAKRWEEYGFEIYIGDQSDSLFWQEFTKTVPNFDILLDDGGHTNLQQLVTLFEMSKIVKPGGLIVIEDTHASYQKEFGNPSRLSFVNVTKRLIDGLNQQFDNLKAIKFIPEGVHSIEYFESIVAFKFSTSAERANSIVHNNGFHLNNLDFRYANHSAVIKLLQKAEELLSLNYQQVGAKRSYLRFFNLLLKNIHLKKITKVLLAPIHKVVRLTIGALLKYETWRYLRGQHF